MGLEHSVDNRKVDRSSRSSATRCIIAGMAQWQVTIRAHMLIREDEDDECQFCEQYDFMWSGPDLITTMMSIQQKLDVLNESQKQKWKDAPRDARFMEEFQIVGIVETDNILFGDGWIKEYVEKGVISRDYEDQEN